MDISFDVAEISANFILMMPTREALLAEIETFLVETGMSARRFGLGAVKDGSLIGRLRCGLDVTTGTADRISQFMRDYRPVKSQRRRCSRSCAA